MKATSFSYDFTAKELVCFLFKKKVCSKCSGKMKKERCCRIVDGSIVNASSKSLFLHGDKVKCYFYRYTCEQCGAEFTLSELAK